MNNKKNLLPGVSVMKLRPFNDIRGSFLKTYSPEIIKELEINFSQLESFTSISKKNVIRGMHYQETRARYKYKKLVTCVMGAAIDVIVDIDKNSIFYNQPISIKLCSEEPLLISMPVSYAHGFIAIEENTIMQYSTNLRYNKEADKGVYWKSIDFKWPTTTPIVSARDSQHPKLGT